MKLIRKIAAGAAAALLSLTMALTAGASKITDWWAEADLSEVDTYATIIDNGYDYSGDFDDVLYAGLHNKYEATAPGTLTFDLTCQAPNFTLSVCNANGRTVKASSISLSEGTGKYDNYDNIKFTRDASTKRVKGKVTFELEKGTYYILYTNMSSTGGELHFVSTYKKAVMDNTITVSLKKGSTMQLSAGKGVAWTSSKKNIATVSSSGLVTAKKKGTTVITATDGTKTLKLNIKVV